MSSITGSPPPDYNRIYEKAVTDAATSAIEDNLSRINAAVQLAGDPDGDPNDPSIQH